MSRIIIAEIKSSGDWINITTNEDKEIGIFVGKGKDGKMCNPNMKIELSSKKAGDEVEMDVKAGKDGDKLFGWEVRSGSNTTGKTFPPKNWEREAAYYSAQATSSLLSLQKEVTYDKWEEMANKIQKWIMSQTKQV